MKTMNVIIFALFLLFFSGCANNPGVIKIRSKNLLISAPPVNWNKYRLPSVAGSSMSRECSGAIYSVAWKNEDGSSIGLAAVKAVGPSGIPLIKTDIFQYSSTVYMDEGISKDVERLRDICEELEKEYIYYPHDSVSQFKQYDMYQNKMSVRVSCNDPEETFPLIIEMVSIWSDTYYYIFQLTVKERDYERDLVVFQNIIDSFSPLSEK